MENKRRLIIVTGLSGAGKSTVLNALEDCNFDTIDNLPLPLVSEAVEYACPDHNLAIGIDARTRGFSPAACERLIAKLSLNQGWIIEVLFLDASDDVLQQRYSETRRRHPLAEDGPIEQGIKIEQEHLKAIRLLADTIIDTSHFKLADARKAIKDRYDDATAQGLIISVTSFGFSKGLPRSADLVFDVRFLKNPHYVLELRDSTGQTDAVANYIKQDEGFAPFMNHVSEMLAFLMPRYQAEGKSYLTIAFGCTGGKHRSVMVAEQIAALFKTAGMTVQIHHRDMPV